MTLLYDITSTLNYTEGDGEIVIDNSITIANANDDYITGATIYMNTAYSGEEFLSYSYNLPASITADNSGTSIEFTGWAPASVYEAILESITYHYTFENHPTSIGSFHTYINWLIGDGINSDVFQTNITVTAANDPPAGTDKTITINEDNSHTFAASDFGFSDSYSGNNNLNAVIISSIPAAGSLTLNGNAVSANESVAAADITNLVFSPAANANGTSYASFSFQVQDDGGTTNGGIDTDPTPNTITFNVTAVDDQATITGDTSGTGAEDTSTITGNLSATDTEGLTDSTYFSIESGHTPANGSASIDPESGAWSYTPNANFNGTDQFTVTVTDDLGGTTTQQIDLTIAAVNDAPAGTDKTITISEDGSHTFTASDFGFSDTDNNNLNTVIIASLPAAGSLTLNGNAVTTSQSIAAADISNLVFSPAENANGTAYASFSFQVQDDGGTANGGVDTDQSAHTITFNVTAVNDAPAGTDKTITINEDAPYTFNASDFGFSDPIDGDSLSAVIITSTPTAGSLTFNGTTLGGFQLTPIAAADISNLTYIPAAGVSGTAYASFTFRVQDDGGTSNGGVNTDQSANAITFDILNVNDAPAINSSKVGIYGLSIGSGTDRGYGVAVQADGKVVLTGYSWNGKEDEFLTVRFNTDGSLDESFADDGIARLDVFTVNDPQNIDNFDLNSQPPVNNGDDRSYRNIIDENQNIVVSGLANDENGNYHLAAVRYLNDGRIDTDFASNGIFTNQIATTTSIVVDIALAADGGYYLIAEYQNKTDITKIDSDGNLAPTFGANGTLSLPTGSTAIVSSDGQLYELHNQVSTFNSDTGSFEITKYDSSGNVDASFGNSGTATGLSVTIPGSVLVSAFTQLAADSQHLYIGLTNYASFSTTTTHLIRVDLASGQIDTSYGSNGVVNLPANARRAKIDGDGRLVINHFGQDYKASRLNPDGTFDATFGTQGTTAPFDLDGLKNYGWDLAIDPNSKRIYIGGNRYQDDGNNDFAIAAIDDKGNLASEFIDTRGAIYLENSGPIEVAKEIVISDEDSSTLASATISFGANYNNADSLQFANDGASMGNISGAWDASTGVLTLLSDGASASLAEWQAAMRSVTYQNLSTNLTQSGTTRTLSWTISDGNSSSEITPTYLTIIPINEAPAGTDKTVAINEDETHTFSESDFGFSDPVDRNNLSAVIIASLPAAGSLTLNGNAVTTNQSVAAADITNLVFSPAANANGTAYTSFTFQVQDDGGTANATSVDTDPTANTITFDVTAVNDTPVVITAGVVTPVAEDSANTPAIALWSTTPVYGTGGGSDETSQTLSYTITAIPAFINLFQADGTTPIAANATLTAAEFAALTYQTVADGNGSGSLTFDVIDSGSSTSPNSNTLSNQSVVVTVNAVNDAPAGTDKTITIKEDNSHTFAASDFGLSDPLDSNNLNAVIISSIPAAGSLTLNGNAVSANESVAAADISNLVFSPAENANGTAYASFTFQVQDDGGTANGGVDTDPSANTITFNVTAVDDQATITGDTSGTGAEDASTITGNLSATDTEGLTDSTYFSIESGHTPANGSASIDPESGAWSYTPNANFNGTDQFTVTITDDLGGTTTQQIDLTITAVNDEPAGTDKTISISEDGSHTFTASDFGFSDTDNNNLNAVIISSIPAAGSLTLNGNAVSANESVAAADISNLVFSPAENANGTAYASFTFQVQDDGGTANGGVDTDPSANTITFNVTAVDDQATITGDTSGTDAEDTSTITGNLSATDTEGLTDSTYFSIESGHTPANGSASIDPESGAWSYTPNANFNGTDQFTVTVTDDLGGTTTQQIDLTITAVNDEPAGTDKTISISEDGSHTFTASDFGFSDTDNNNLNAVIISSIPAAGSLTLNGNAVSANESVAAADITNLVFSPAANANGTSYASFTFQVQDDGGTANGGVDTDPSANTITFNVTAVDDQATITGDTSGTGAEDASTITGNLSATDTEGLTDSTYFSIESGHTPANGSASIDPESGAWSYTPNANFNGTDQFTVTVTDDLGGTTTQQIDLTITAVNDAPAGTDKTITISEDGSHTFTASDFSFSDTDNNNLNAVIISSIPAAGSLRRNGNAVSANEFIGRGAGGRLVFSPAADANGTAYASFTFQVQDDGGTANGGVDTDPSANTITFNVTAVDDQATITGDTSGTGAEDASTITGNLSATDTEGLTDSTYFSIESGHTPANGSASIDPESGAWSYTPNANFNGTDQFTVTVTDDLGGTTTQQIDLTITAVDDQATITGDTSGTGAEDASTITGNLSATDTEGLTDSTYFSIESGHTPANGSASIDPESGAWSYTPNANFNGTDQFTVTITDDLGGTTTQHIDLTITAVDDQATITGDTSGTGTEDASTITGNLSATDTEGLTDSTYFSIESGHTPANGSASIDPESGAWSYTPNANFNGTDQFTVTVTDDLGGTTTQQIDLTITAVDDQATITGDTSGTDAEDTSTITGNLSATDTEGLTDSTYFSIESGHTPANGSASIDPESGAWSYTPNANFNGTDQFTVTVTDDLGGTTTQQIDLTITAVDDQATITGDTSGTDAEDTSTITGNLSATDTEGLTDSTYFSIESGHTPANGSASIDPESGAWSYTPNANFNGTDQFTVTVTDDLGGTTTQQIDLTITAVNDEPAGTDKTISISEDGSHTFTASDFGFSDTDNNNLNAVIISSIPAAGSLTLNGNAVSANESVAAADITNLVFSPAANANGTSYASFTFQVQDDGGTANGGVDTDPSANTITFNVTAVDDQATITGDTSGTGAEDASTITGNLSATDTEGLTDSTYFSIESGHTPANGSASIDPESGAWSYTPNANFNGTDQFTVTVTDDLGGTTTQQIDLTITAVNDAPAGTDKTITISEDGSHTFTASDFSFSDTDNNSLNAVIISSIPAAGSLRRNGNAVSANEFISAAGAGGRLVFSPAADANGTAYASFTFQVQDDGGTANGGVDTDPSPNTITFNVTAVDDQATITGDTSGSVTEDSDTTTATGTLSITDVDADDSPAFADLAETSGDNAYGSFSLTSGTWTYTLDNANTTVDALDDGDTLTDTYTFTATDGTTQSITVTINGETDPLTSDDLKEVITAADGELIDGNGDGIADAEQSDVFGLIMINDGADNTDYGALETDPALSFSAISFLKPTEPATDTAGTGTNPETYAVTTRDGQTQTTTIPSGIDNAFAGLLAFTVSGLSNGGSTSTTISLPKGLNDLDTAQLAYLRFNYATNRFEDFVDPSGTPLYSFQDSNGDGLIDSVVLQLVDGDQAWDGDGIANGSIIDPGFLATGDRNITGNRKANTLEGNVLANTLRGRNGNDTLLGDLGNDTLIGNRKRDRLIGGEGDDVLKGKSGSDVLKGGAHDDRLDGGKGDDTLIGGNGADRFRISDGKDTIKDFSIAEGDLIDANGYDLQLTQSGNNLLLTDSEQGIKTKLLNVDQDDLLQQQPELLG